MFGDPAAAALFDLLDRLGMDGPVVEGAPARRLAGGVAPPARLAAHHGHVRGYMAAVKQRHPEMTRRVISLVVGRAVQHAAALAHALEVDDRFGEHRKTRRRY